jgi:hypothetical protein
MKHPFLILLTTLCAATGYGQTMKALSYNTSNNQVFANIGTNNLTFTNNLNIAPSALLRFDGGNTHIDASGFYATQFGSFLSFEEQRLRMNDANVFEWDSNGVVTFGNAAATRTNLGLGATWLTNDNVTNFRTAIGLGENDGVIFDSLTAINFQATAGTNYVQFNSYSVEFGGISASRTRTNLGLGPTNIVTFAGLTNNGDITINSTTASNGLLFIRRTNNEPFLGLANLIASNNTTISNETLFRVGVAEATNQSAQFGFRSTNTNGSGVAVFSVFGYNALMMVGADASTNAVIFSGGGTNNEVMTLIRDGATEFARPIRFSTNASTRPATNAPANTTNVAAWVEFRIGTNSYRAALYQ